MKKFLSILLVSVGLFASKVNAQDFTWSSDNTHDTIYALNYVDQTVIYDTVTNNLISPLTLSWKVIATNFPADWLPGLGLCDNKQCYGQSGPTPLWFPSTNAGTLETSNPYASGVKSDFHFISTLGTTTGTYFITVAMFNPAVGGTADTMTYIVSKSPTAVANVTRSADDIVLYPNPATENVNVLFNGDAGVKTISIHNVIGKMMSIYKVSGNSAQLNLDNIPKGIYFVRLQDAQGAVIATRRFTRQ